VALVRAMSGAASEKYPQTNQSVHELSFSYRMIPEVVPYISSRFNGTPPGMYDRDWTNYTAYTNVTAPLTDYEWQWRSNYYKLARTYETNLHDFRLIFRWPLLNAANAGNRRQVFRTTVGGNLLQTTDPFVPHVVYFFEPRSFVKAQP
jgi:hypothetical protein